MIGANSMVVNNPPAPPASNRSVPKKVIDNQNMGHDIIADASQQPQATQNLPSAQPMAIPLFYGTNAAGMMQKGQDLQQQQQQQHHQQHHQQQQQQQQHQQHQQQHQQRQHQHFFGVNPLWMSTMQQGGLCSGVWPKGDAVINPSIQIEDMHGILEMQKEMGKGKGEGNQPHVNFSMGGFHQQPQHFHLHQQPPSFQQPQQ